jgi:hypothetical protein
MESLARRIETAENLLLKFGEKFERIKQDLDDLAGVILIDNKKE